MSARPVVERSDPDVTSCPPSYRRQHSSPGGGLTFVDFLPCCVNPGTVSSSPTFEPFRMLVQRANEWLKEHCMWEVKTCESVEFKASKSINTELMTYCEYGKWSTCYMRGLRLWLVPRLDKSRPAQQLEYRNLVPQQMAPPAGSFGMPMFETLQELLERYNKQLVHQPAPGCVLAVETQETNVPSFLDFDPDQSYWSAHGRRDRHFIFVVRVFYEVGSMVCEEIGVADFVPVRHSAGSMVSMPRYEPFSSVIARAAQWCSQQSSLRFCNVQTLEIKLKSDPSLDSSSESISDRTVVDTQCMSYTERAKVATFYVRVLRVAYIKELVPPEGGLPPSPPLALHCKTFMPLPLTQSVFMPEFEGLSATKKRVEAWINATGARVLSCETIAMRLFIGGEACAGIESSFTFNSGKQNEYWIFVLRVYLDGVYQEPPQEALPPVPEVCDDERCAIL
ncbi:hypothetical protein V5799_017111 [Amblyomma americanum]|uniref:Uncharacterized protein n=1 Tax=Amblyomma americanum TaxID=6943 RepID=A0AAQ4F4D6_AMBAM